MVTSTTTLTMFVMVIATAPLAMLMVVSAATSIPMFVVMFATTTVVTATSATTRVTVSQLFQFFGTYLLHTLYLARKVQHLARERVIKVHFHTLGRYGKHLPHHCAPLRGLHREHTTNLKHLGHHPTVNLKNRNREGNLVVLKILSVAILWLQFYLEGLAWL